MGRKERGTADIPVRVLDLEPVFEQVLEAWKENPDELPDGWDVESWDELSSDEAWGLVDTPEGVFAVSDEGRTYTEPLSEDVPLEISVFPGGEKDDGTRWFGAVPVGNIPLSPDDLDEVPVEETVDLSEHVRSFGPRLERNYAVCQAVLNKALGRDYAEHLVEQEA